MANARGEQVSKAMCTEPNVGSDPDGYDGDFAWKSRHKVEDKLRCVVQAKPRRNSTSSAGESVRDMRLGRVDLPQGGELVVGKAEAAAFVARVEEVTVRACNINRFKKMSVGYLRILACLEEKIRENIREENVITPED